MAKRKTRTLENTVAAIQQRHGRRALSKGDYRRAEVQHPHVSSGFPALDAVTGCGGFPLGAASILRGHTTSGKLTLAYKVLANAQRSPQGEIRYTAALLDLTANSDPDYLMRCGVSLEHLLIVRPGERQESVELLLDLARSRDIRMILVDSLSELAMDRALLRRFHASLDALNNFLRQSGCGLILIDDPSPPWHRWAATGWLLDPGWPVQQKAMLHIEMRRERWLRQAGELVGYQAQARVLTSRWRHDARGAPIEIRFNGTVEARPSW